MLHNFSRCLEKNAGFETNHLKVLYYDLEKGYEGTYRSYEYNRICTIMEGTKQVSINQGSQILYDPTDFILLPPHSNVDMVIPEHTKAIVYEVSDKLVSTIKENLQNTLDTELEANKLPSIRQHNIRTISPHISKINKALTTDDSDKAFFIDLVSQELVYDLLKKNFIKKTHTFDKSNPVEYSIQYMNKNVDKIISLSELAFTLHISSSSLSTKFKKATGYSPKEYFNLIKIKRAKDLLSTKNVTEVCYDLGYENISHFISLFKKHFGMTPKQYSLNIQQGKYY